jgi:hypothetical protein
MAAAKMANFGQDRVVCGPSLNPNCDAARGADKPRTRNEALARPALKIRPYMRRMIAPTCTTVHSPPRAVATPRIIVCSPPPDLIF